MDANRVRELIATAKTTADELETYAGPIAFLAEGYEQRGAELERLEAERDTLREALEALNATVDGMACATDPTAPCAEVETGFDWPDDWCLTCYVKRIVQEVLECGAGTEQP